MGNHVFTLLLLYIRFLSLFRKLSYQQKHLEDKSTPQFQEKKTLNPAELWVRNMKTTTENYNCRNGC